jgi:hypothetical protein
MFHRKNHPPLPPLPLYLAISPSAPSSLRTPSHAIILSFSHHRRSVGRSLYEVGLGFIFLLPPVMVTLMKRRTYWRRFLARPLGVFFFS